MSAIGRSIRKKLRRSLSPTKGVPVEGTESKSAQYVGFSNGLLNSDPQNGGTVENDLDHLPVGVILVDRAMRVESANRRGREILSEASGLRIEGGRLVAPAAQDRALRTLVAAALGMPPGRPSVLRIDRPSGGVFEVSANPVPGVATFWGPGASRAALFVHDQQSDDSLSPAALELLYEMTPAEARLAALLVGGEELRAAAEMLNVTLNTVRTQLKSIFAKTGTRRQSELVHRLLSSPARFQTLGR